MPQHDVLVVGAGLAGLTAATRLVEAGRSVVVIDKGRGVGGRMAHRRTDAGAFDHGAQFFSTRGAEFRMLAEGWAAEGAAAVWHERRITPTEDVHDGYPRWRGAPGMTAPAKALAAELPDVRLGARVVGAEWVGSEWRARTAEGQDLRAGALVMTPPVPQALELLDAGAAALPAGARSALSAIVYDPCVAVLLSLASSPELPAPGTRVWPPGDILDRVTDNQVKGVSERPTVTVHLAAAPSRSWWDDTDDAIVSRTLARLRDELPALSVTATTVHRWRYAKPTETHPEATLLVEEPGPIAFAGDAFGGPLVEGAFRSGVAAAASLLQVG